MDNGRPSSQVSSLPLTWHLAEGPSKRKLIFQVPPTGAMATWEEGQAKFICHIPGKILVYFCVFLWGPQNDGFPDGFPLKPSKSVFGDPKMMVFPK